MTGIIQYGAGNIFSLTAALDRLGIAYGMVSTLKELPGYDRYIIPGVGHAGAAMEKLRQTGLAGHIDQLTKPVLGVCVGMQLLTAHSEEGNANLLNIIPVKTKHFPETAGHKVPHTGWNRVQVNHDHHLFKNIPPGEHFYFVHSYYIEHKPEFTLGTTNYSLEFCASIWRDNFFGVQFHPEKSGKAGETLLLNFSKL